MPIISLYYETPAFLENDTKPHVLFLMIPYVHWFRG